MMKTYEFPTIENNPEAIRYQAQRLQELQQDPRVLSFLSKNGLDIDVLEHYFPFFDRWLLFLDDDASVAELQVDGYHYQLFYDDDFYFQYVKTQERKDEEKKLKFIKRIVINHIPQSMRLISLADIKTDASMDVQYLLALTELNRFLAKPVMDTGFYLYGGVGSGKTYLLVALINDLARLGQWVGFINMVRFLQDLRNAFGEDDRFVSLMNQVKSVDYLVIDDIGAEVVSDWSLRILIEILDERMNRTLSTHFTTNLAPQALLNYYTKSQSTTDEINAKRIMDRVNFLAKPFLIDRKSQRIRKD